MDFASVETKLAQVIESSHAIGHKFIVNPWLDEEMRKQPDVWKRVAATFNKAGRRAKRPASSSRITIITLNSFR